MKINIKIKNQKEKITSLSDETFGTVFSGEVDRVQGIFLITSEGLFRLDNPETPYIFGSLFATWKTKPTATNYRELNSTLTIE